MRVKTAPRELLQRQFKLFSLKTACRTLLPTVGYWLSRSPLPPSEKPALFTMNILPPMMRVWHHCVKKYLGDRVDVTIFDCSGRLDPKNFPGARVQKYLNFYAATKSDEFLNRIAKNRKIGWICDDDIFLINEKAVDRVVEELNQPNTVSLSFRPRTWWEFNLDGKKYFPSSSYCIAFNREIFVDKEHLSLAPASGNEHPSIIGKPPKRYDTGDLSNEILLKKGYRCAIVPKEEESTYITGFSGMSGAVILLDHFKTAEQTVEFFTPENPKQWEGNVLYGTFAAMLAIDCIQDCHEKITGARYPLPSLPSKEKLAEIKKIAEPNLRPGTSFAWIDEGDEKLRKAM
jgi:hypothetical protein